MNEDPDTVRWFCRIGYFDATAGIDVDDIDGVGGVDDAEVVARGVELGIAVDESIKLPCVGEMAPGYALPKASVGAALKSAGVDGGGALKGGSFFCSRFCLL